MYFNYDETAINYLKKHDKKLAHAIEQIGPIKRGVNPDIFSSIVKHIVGQQISTIAQETIYKRLCEKLNCLDASSIQACPREDLQSCGLSFRKVDYIKDFAQKVDNGEFCIKSLASQSDEEIIVRLSALNGIGVWTAEMLLIFCLQRPNVLSFGDLAIQRGLRMLYRHRKITRELFSKYAKRYTPYGSVASLYIWAIAGGALPELNDPAPKTPKKKT